MLYANDERHHDRNQERDHDHERDLIAAVAEALGERRSLIRRHGFQMIEIVVYDDPSNLASDRSQDNDRDNYQDECREEYPDVTKDNSDLTFSPFIDPAGMLGFLLLKAPSWRSVRGPICPGDQWTHVHIRRSYAVSSP